MRQMTKCNWFCANVACKCSKSDQTCSASNRSSPNIRNYCIRTTICSSNWNKNWQQSFVTWAQRHMIIWAPAILCRPPIIRTIAVFSLSKVYWNAKLTCAKSSCRCSPSCSRAFRAWKPSHCTNNLCRWCNSPSCTISTGSSAHRNIWWILFITPNALTVCHSAAVIFDRLRIQAYAALNRPEMMLRMCIFDRLWN